MWRRGLALAPYRSAREDGLRRYCTRARGFEEGRDGDAYHQVCPATLEADFLPAYRDGQAVHAAESAVESAVSAIDGYVDRLEELDDKIEAKQGECGNDSLDEKQRQRACDRIGELREEKRDRRRDLRDAEDGLALAERDARELRYRFAALYGDW